jgi:hypothetical protein
VLTAAPNRRRREKQGCEQGRARERQGYSEHPDVRELRFCARLQLSHSNIEELRVSDRRDILQVVPLRSTDDLQQRAGGGGQLHILAAQRSADSSRAARYRARSDSRAGRKKNVADNVCASNAMSGSRFTTW